MSSRQASGTPPQAGTIAETLQPLGADAQRRLDVAGLRPVGIVEMAELVRRILGPRR